MAHYFCIAVGMADCTPNSQEYFCASSAEMPHIIKTACDEWIAEYNERPTDDTRGDEFFQYEFKMPRDGEDNYSQRLLIGGSDDWVLDVIGMTADDWAREAEDLT